MDMVAPFIAAVVVSGTFWAIALYIMNPKRRDR
jgi:lipopolysaccharide export LptBFGC system permease protein LptF